jgi:tape measure domain-containing protein
MAGLSAIFRLTDAFTPVINRIYNSTTAATSSIGRASAATDNLNSQFTSSGNATSALTSKLTTLIGTLATFATVKKAMDLSDTYTNTSSRLSLITNNLQEQKSLQNEIFSAADRSRGSYSDMASSVAKLGVTAGSYFTGNDQIVKFVETMQKSFKLGGTSTADQSAAMLQMSQALGSGKLQGDEFRSITENAPVAANAIAKYLGKSVGELKQLSTDGKLTSDVVINGILSASSTVDEQVSKMSYTFGDYWNEISTGATKAFTKVFESTTSALNSKGFQTFIDNIISGFNGLATAANNVLGAIGNIAQFFQNNWSVIEPIILGIAAAVATLTIMTQLQAAAQAIVAATNPVTLIILGIAALIVIIYEIVNAVNKATGATTSAAGIIIGAISVAIAFIENIFIGLWNFLVEVFVDVYNLITEVASFLNNVFTDPVGSVIRLFSAMGDTILGIFESIDKMVDSVLHTDLSSGIASLRSQLANATKSVAGTAKTSTPWKKLDASTYSLKANNYSTVWTNAYKTGTNIDSSISKALAAAKKASTAATGTTGAGTGTSASAGTSANPTTVTGTGSGGAVTVNIADQDLQYLRDLAEKDYVNKFSTAVLSPKVSIKIASTNATDLKELSNQMSVMMREEIATAAEGSYD